MSFNRETVGKIKKNFNLSKEDAENVMRTVFEDIKGYVQVHGSAKIPCLGTFKLRTTKERMGRNPRTGESVPVSAKTKLVFKEAK